MIAAYYKFVCLPDDVRTKNGIRSKQRLDCITHAGEWQGMTNFVNKQGHLSLYKVPKGSYMNGIAKRHSEWSLTNNSLNFSSIYFEDPEYIQFGYGYPNKKELLSNGLMNPLFPYRNDCFLFVTNLDLTEIEVLIFKDARNLVSHYYQYLIDGMFDNELNDLRNGGKPYFKYIGLGSEGQVCNH